MPHQPTKPTAYATALDSTCQPSGRPATLHSQTPSIMRTVLIFHSVRLTAISGIVMALPLTLQRVNMTSAAEKQEEDGD